MLRPEQRREYLTVADVAAELACSEATVRRRIRAGEIPAMRLGGVGSGVRIPRAWLEDGEPPLPRLTPRATPHVRFAAVRDTDSGLALSIYAHAMRRDDGENESLRALVEGEFPRVAR